MLRRDFDAALEHRNRIVALTELLMKVSELLLRGQVRWIVLEELFEKPLRLSSVVQCGVFKRQSVATEAVIRIRLEQRLQFGNPFFSHSSSMALANVKSFSVNPPALCVDSASVTLFQRMSMSG